MSARRSFVDLAPARSACGRVRVPGSKSISNRVLLLAALAEGATRISGLLHSDDTTVMIEALHTLGVPMRESDAELEIEGAATFPKREADLFVGNSGLAIRTLTAALAFAHGRYRVSGIARMHERPLGDLVDALRAIGAQIAYEASEGYPPLRIEPPASMHATASSEAERRARVVRVRGDTSSQFLTGLLQAAPLLAADADLIVEVEGALISRPYVDLTLALMKRFGVIVDEQRSNRFVVASGSRYISPGRFVVEGDASSASYLLAAGLLGGGPVRVEGFGRDSLQGDARFVDVLIAMGAEVVHIGDDDDAIEVRSPGVASGFRLRAIDADFNDIPDAAMTVAVLALFADGPSTLRNIGSWRVKETDRIAAMANELKKFDATVEAGDDWLRIEPAWVPPQEPARVPMQDPLQLPSRASTRTPIARPIVVDTYDDHRIAMCFSLTTFLGVPVRINDPDCVAKTFPDYFERFETIVAHDPLDGRAAMPSMLQTTRL